MLVFQVASGVFLGGVALFIAYILLMIWMNSPSPVREPFNWKLVARRAAIYIGLVGALLLYIILADAGQVPCWMLVDDSNWRAVARCR